MNRLFKNSRLVIWAFLGVALLTSPWYFPGSRAADDNPYDKFREKQRKNAIREDDELKFSEAAHQEIAKENRFITDSQVVNYVTDVGRRCAARSERPNLNYQFYVIDNNQINAFTPGGGRVYVYSGLLKACTTEGQLAAVLAHEIGHNAGYHVSSQLKESQTIGILAAIAGAVAGNGTIGNITKAATGLVANGYLFKRSRDAEREADYLGLYDMKSAGYNTEEMNNMFRLLESLGKKPGAIDKIFASHPPATERLANTQREITEHLVGSNRQGTSTTAAFDAVKRRLGSLPASATGTPPPASSSGSSASTGGTSAGADADVREAERVLDRLGDRSSRVIQALRGNVTGRESGLVVVYQQRDGGVRGVIDIKGLTYELKINANERSLPLRDVFKLRIRDEYSNQNPDIVVVSSDRNNQRRRDFWRWDGRNFRYIGTD
ncbi:MAG: M48 family metalloprotease [Blastocatellia bacterium]|nr:M48 family metalloprotease [Blastocatellia bacterium]